MIRGILAGFLCNPKLCNPNGGGGGLTANLGKVVSGGYDSGNSGWVVMEAKIKQSPWGGGAGRLGGSGLHDSQNSGQGQAGLGQGLGLGLG